MDTAIDIKEFVRERVEKNHLPIDVDKALAAIEAYKSVYPNETEIKLFFYYVKNEVGGIINKLDHHVAEHLGWLLVRGRGNITFYEFDDEDDFLVYLEQRPRIYAMLDNDQKRMLNYLELTTMNFIHDITTKSKYVLEKGGAEIKFEKTGYGQTFNTMSFIKYVGQQFKDGYTFTPVI